MNKLTNDDIHEMIDELKANYEPEVSLPYAEIYGKLNNKRLMYFSAWIMKKRMTMTVKEFEGVSIHEALVEYEEEAVEDFKKEFNKYFKTDKGYPYDLDDRKEVGE